VTGVNIEDKNNHTKKTGDNEIFLNNDDSAAGKNQDPVTQVQAGREYEETLKEAVEEPGGDDLSILQKQLEEQKNRAEDFYNRLARLQADYENFRRRTRLEKEDLCKYASEQLVLKLLPVLDNFERALEAEGDSLKDYKSGVEMIYRQFQDVLSLEGVEATPATAAIGPTPARRAAPAISTAMDGAPGFNSQGERAWRKAGCSSIYFSRNSLCLRTSSSTQRAISGENLSRRTPMSRSVWPTITWK
jgi:molecular chaperone GrpE (heat shock protein)